MANFKKAGRENWQSDASATHCSMCSAKFGVLRWRHHCRACGQIFCQACCCTKIDYTPHARKQDRDYTPKRKKVCEACFVCIYMAQAAEEEITEQADGVRHRLLSSESANAGDKGDRHPHPHEAPLSSTPGKTFSTISTVSEGAEPTCSFENLVQSIPCRSSQEKAGDLWAQQVLAANASSSSNSSSDGSMIVKQLAQEHDKSTVSTGTPPAAQDQELSSTAMSPVQQDTDESAVVQSPAPVRDAAEDRLSSSSHAVDEIGLWAEQLERLNDQSTNSSKSSSASATGEEAAIGQWGEELQALNDDSLRNEDETPQEKAAAVLDKQFKIANYVHGELDVRLAQMNRDDRKLLLTYYWYNLQAQRAALEAHLFAPTSQEAAEELQIARQKIKQCANFIRDLHAGKADVSKLSNMCPKNAHISQKTVMALSMKVLTLSMRFMHSSNEWGCESWTSMPAETRTTSTVSG